MPVEWKNHITSDPEILHGKPRIKGTRIPVSLILGYLAAEKSAEEIMAEFPDLKRDQIAACLGLRARSRGVPSRRLMSLRFFADHCVSNLIIHSLESAGHQVLRLKDHLPVESPDSAVIAKAQELDAILLSLNGDFADIVAYPPGQFQGIFALQVLNHPEVAPYLVERLKKYLSSTCPKEGLYPGGQRSSLHFAFAPWRPLLGRKLGFLSSSPHNLRRPSPGAACSSWRAGARECRRPSLPLPAFQSPRPGWLVRQG